MDYMLEEQKDQKPYQKLKKDFLQYGLFIANVLQARSPAEVKAAIRMVALPPGSSQAKKQSTFDISVNSYFGVYGGREILLDPDVIDPINPTYGKFSILWDSYLFSVYKLKDISLLLCWVRFPLLYVCYTDTDI